MKKLNYKGLFTIIFIFAVIVATAFLSVANNCSTAYATTDAKKTVRIGVTSLNSVYGEELLPLTYEVENPEVFAEGESAKDLNISLHKETGTDVGIYAITGTYDNENYNVIFYPATYTITPKKLSGYLVGINNLVYNGQIIDVKCELLGEGATLGLTTTVTFDKAVRNAGDYTAYVKVNDKNYEMEKDGIFTFSVKKAPLTITLDDMAYTNVDEPLFIYEGFVNGETEENLAVRPKADLPTATGAYMVLPYGAESNNYEITYVAGNVTVYKTTLETEGVTFVGNFHPTAKLTAEETDDYNGFSPKGIVTYAVNLDAHGGVFSMYEGKIAGVSVSTKYLLRACIVDELGQKHTLDSFSVNEDGLSFRADSDGVLILYYDLTIPVIVAVVLVLLILIIVIKVTTDKRKYRNLSAMRRVAEEQLSDALWDAERAGK